MGDGLAPDARQGERRRPGRPKGGRRESDPILDLATHPAPLVTVGQLAAYWGKHAYTINAYIREGRLAAHRVGWEYRVTIAAALAFERADADWHTRRHNISK